MKRFIAILLLLLPAFPALAQLPPSNGITVNVTPVSGGSTLQCLYISSTRKVGAQACGSGTAADITVGTTTVTGGSNGNILGKAAGVLSVLTTSGSGTVVALATSPALVTPTLDVATGTSLALGGATIGTNALAITGTTLTNNTITSTIGTITTNKPALSATQTWNAVGVAFQAIFANVTNTASAAGSYTLELQRAGVHKFGVTAAGDVDSTSFTISGSAAIGFDAGGHVNTPATGIYGFSANSTITGASDTAISRVSAGVIGVGTGAQGSIAGSLSMAGITASGASVVFSGLGSDTATTNNTACVTSTTGVLTKGSGTLGICLGTSSRRFKHDIAYGVEREAGDILALEPVSYRYNGGDERKLYGFIAEDVAKTMPELVALDVTGKPNSIDMLGMIPFLVEKMKAQERRITSLESR